MKFSNGQTLYDNQCPLYTAYWKVNDVVTITAETTQGFYTVVDPSSPQATPNPNYPQPNSSPFDTTTRVMVDPAVYPAGAACQS